MNSSIIVTKEKIYLKSVKDVMDFTKEMETIDNAEIKIAIGDNRFNAKSVISVLNCVKFNSPIYLECISKDSNICGLVAEKLQGILILLSGTISSVPIGTLCDDFFLSKLNINFLFLSLNEISVNSYEWLINYQLTIGKY